MKTMRFGLVGIVLVSFLILLPGTALARTSLHVSIGSNRCSGFYPGWQPSPRRYGGHYRWLDRGRYQWIDKGRYRWMDSDRYRFSHRRRRYDSCFRTPRYDLGFRYRSPRVTTFVFGYRDWDYYRPDCYIITPPPLVIERPPKIIEKEVVIVRPEKHDKEREKLFRCLREKKNELLKKLKIGSKEERKKAIDELAGFSFNNKVRKALEDILLSDPDPELRKQVARSFGDVKNKEAVPVLEKARVEDSDEEVRKEADKAIKKIKGY